MTGLKMSGTVGSFTLADGKTLDEPTVRAVVEAKELTFVKMTSERRAAAQAVWHFAGEGPT